MAGFLRIITQAVLTATPRKRPPLGLLVIAKLTLYIFPLHFATIFHRNYVNLQHADYIFTKLFYHFTAKITTVESVLVRTSILTDFFQPHLPTLQRTSDFAQPTSAASRAPTALQIN